MVLSRQQPIEKFEQYLSALLAGLNLTSAEKAELKEEWRQHLYDHYAMLLVGGMGREQAVRTVLEQFGGIEMLQHEVNRAYPSPFKQHVLKELLIALLSLAACLIGPKLLIGAVFQPYFILAPAVFLVMAYALYHLVIKHQTNWILSLIGVAAVYGYFLQLLLPESGAVFTSGWYIKQLFTLEWGRLAGASGLFNFVTLHMFWYALIAVRLLTDNHYIPVWKRIANASFHYWAMLLAAVLLARWQPSSELSVLLLNVFLIYAFWQQALSLESLTRLKQKINRMMIRQELS